MRRPIKKRPTVSPDIMYGSVDVERLINYVMLDGKKETSRKIVYGAFEVIKADKDTSDDPLETFNAALRNAGPLMEVRSRRVGGANYQVPREVRAERRQALAYPPTPDPTSAAQPPQSKDIAHPTCSPSLQRTLALTANLALPLPTLRRRAKTFPTSIRY